MLKIAIFSTILAIAVAQSAVAGEVLVGRVVGVHDGDTATVLTPDNVQHKIRLAGIDAPELKQPFGQDSKRALSDIIMGSDPATVEVDVVTRDRYHREVGIIRLVAGGLAPVNQVMVEDGAAYVYWQYEKKTPGMDFAALGAAEDVARYMGSGVWGLQADQQVRPWDYRKER